ncbi:MAG: hypothetical protein AB7E42_08665 [Anaerotignaceae bacterium]
MHNNDLNNSDSNDLEYEELLDNEKVGLEDIYTSQIPVISPGQFIRPRLPGLPGLLVPPVRPSQPQRPSRPQQPTLRQPPTTPPPYTTPQLPRGMAIPSPDSREFNVQYGNFIRTNNVGYQFRSCLNRFTFIWTWYGRTFWYYPIFVNPWSVEGFLWNRGRWIYNSIPLNSIFFYSCF